MHIDDAMKTLGLTWKQGVKIRCNPFARASDMQKVWRSTAARLNMGNREQIERTIAIERADYAAMTAWECLTRHYCNVCDYVVHPSIFHRHCPNCCKLMREKTTGRTDDGYPMFKTWCVCGYEEVDVLD